ncbi:sex differentiation [Nesidiocoris tenuis]|uniref:Sex differentiation n=2 Tax=Nesidiocoris tenuis TaxID=355587 RepID=A0ABN7ALA7_9HEMI|nr:sex differentiation [Nesidiocoris tenuis]
MSCSPVLDQVADVKIDPEGRFKYVLIRVYAPTTKDGNDPSKMIVRGNARGPYHGKFLVFYKIFGYSSAERRRLPGKTSLDSDPGSHLGEMNPVRPTSWKKFGKLAFGGKTRRNKLPIPHDNISVPFGNFYGWF